MSKLIMLDTDICSYIIKQKPVSIAEKFYDMDSSCITISSVTYAELEYGVLKSGSLRIKNIVSEFLKLPNVLFWDISAALEYAKISTSLEVAGTPIGNMDLMIAAHAKSINAMLVTNNIKQYQYVDGLLFENWV